MNHRKKKHHSLWIILLLGIAAFLLIRCCRYTNMLPELSHYLSLDAFTETDSSVPDSTETQVLAADADPMTIYFIDVGQGDATLITCGGESMLVDAGPDEGGLKLWKYLNSVGVSELKYMICTHPDADHIGGADVIAYRCGVSEGIIMPDISNDTSAYDALMETISGESIRILYPHVGDQYKLGSASFTIIGPVKNYGEEDQNDNSVGILLQNGNDRFVMIGDAEIEAENDMLRTGINLSADVYKVAHHGSGNGTSDEFLKAVSPAYAVISCGKGNDYGHPHESVLKKLRSAGVEIYRTDEQGTILCESSGNGVTWTTSR